MQSKKVVSCPDPRCNGGRGNLLLALQGERIFVRHRNPEGNYWQRLTIRIPGINIDFSLAAITQELLSHNFNLRALFYPVHFEGSKIFVQCRNAQCKRWTCVTVGIPDIDLNFGDAAIITEDLPRDYHLDLEPAPLVVIE